jgi:hypothetical protein
MDGNELGFARAFAVHGSDEAFLSEGRVLIHKLIDQIDEARKERDEARKKRDEARQERKKWKPVDPTEYCVPIERFDFSAALYGHVMNRLYRGTESSAVCRVVRKYKDFLTVQDRENIAKNIDKVLTLDVFEHLHIMEEWASLREWLRENP